MEKTVQESRIERGLTKIIVPHEDGEAVFAYPYVGLSTYIDVGERILRQDMNVPTGDYIASLLHSAYCDRFVWNEPEFENIRNIILNRLLWVFNRNLWTSKGVYVVHDLKAAGMRQSQLLNQNDLEEMLKDGKEIQGTRFSRDGLVRFAPKGSYQLGQHTPQSLAKDGFVIASYGVEGAEKLGEVAERLGENPYPEKVSFGCKYKPRIWGLKIEEGEEPKQRVSGLGRGEYFDDDYWFNVDGGNFYWLEGYGIAFGVLK